MSARRPGTADSSAIRATEKKLFLTMDMSPVVQKSRNHSSWFWEKQCSGPHCKYGASICRLNRHEFHAGEKGGFRHTLPAMVSITGNCNVAGGEFSLWAVSLTHWNLVFTLCSAIILKVLTEMQLLYHALTTMDGDKGAKYTVGIHMATSFFYISNRWLKL